MLRGTSKDKLEMVQKYQDSSLYLLGYAATSTFENEVGGVIGVLYCMRNNRGWRINPKGIHVKN